MTIERPVRVVLVDDHSMFRTGVRAELATDSGVEIVGEAGSARRGGGGIARTKPDVVLLDVHMPDGGGKAVLEQVKDASDVLFLALTVRCRRGRHRGDPGGRPRLRDQDDLRPRPRRRGPPGQGRRRGVLAPAGRLRAGRVHRPGRPGIVDPELDLLSPREREVLRLLARGYAYKEIAAQLFISIKTVETHVSSVLRKPQQSNRYELSRWATDRRLV